MTARVAKKPVKKQAAKKISADERRYPARPVVGIGIVIWREDKILLVKRGKEPRKGEWGLPGGVQKLGESIMHAAVREAREETGLDIAPLGIITAIDAVVKDKAGNIEYHYSIIEVASEALEGKAVARDDADEVRWATLEETEKLCKWPEVARIATLSVIMKSL